MNIKKEKGRKKRYTLSKKYLELFLKRIFKSFKNFDLRKDKEN